MRVYMLAIIAMLFVGQVSSQEIVVEKIGEFEEIKRVLQEPEMASPSGMVVDERSGIISINNAIERIEYRIDLFDDFDCSEVSLTTEVIGPMYKFRDFEISSFNSLLRITRGDKDVIFMRDESLIASGVCFVTHFERNAYVCFFINREGIPGAADTNGRVYTPDETMALLKTYDPKKWEESLSRATELGMQDKFLANQVLVWGQTYYSTPRLLEEYWRKVVYPNTSLQIQYDSQGNGYMAAISAPNSVIWIVDPDAEYLARINVTKYSKILSTYEMGRLFGRFTSVSTSGNIYFYVAGEDFTEVFRIRRTWGDPDFYAMAINGYTGDAYGAYVKETLKSLTKEELRLLRNHLFAIYGYVFKSEDLARYFDNQVWYLPDTGATMESIELPFERKALLDMLLAEEKTR